MALPSGGMTAPHARSLSSAAVRSRTLANGLTLLAVADPTSPCLAYVTTYRVGSRNERPGITGISHLFEHMMFNGARKYGPKQFDVVLESQGGTSNAYTTHDVTSYYEVLPAEGLDVVLDLELDRMRDLDLTERNLLSEREVVKEERRMRTDDSPMGMLVENLYAAAFQAHPYRWPVIGWMADLDAISVSDIEAYFRLHYAPNNAVVAMAGGIDADRALDRASEVLGVLKRGPEVPGVVRSEPRQRGERRIKVRKEAQLPSLLSAFHGPDARSADVPVLDVLQAVLTDGDSSRLRRRLVLDDPLAIEVGLDFPWTLDPGLVTAGLTVRPGVDPRRAEDVLHAELARAASEPPTSEELRKAKNQLQADFWRRLETSEGRADQVAGAQVLFGDHGAIFELPSRYEAVTADDVGRVAAEVFREDNRTVALLDPLAAEEAAEP